MSLPASRPVISIAPSAVPVADCGPGRGRLPVLLTVALCATACAEPTGFDTADPSGAATRLVSVDPRRMTVSGISSGGMMAHQLHIAYSDRFSGAAAIAAGPYGCADGSLAVAMARCTGSAGGPLPVAEFVAGLRRDAEAGRIAPTEHLTDDRVWLFHGRADTVVATEVSDALAVLYAEWVAPGNLRYVRDVPAAHHFPTDGRGHACDDSRSPFVGDCAYDAAGELLQFLDAALEAPAGAASARPVEVVLERREGTGLAGTAYLYAPDRCRIEGAGCALHLVLHGCAQSAAHVGTAFIEQSGYLDWAEANDLVLAFPQVEPSASNPYACWDWWGYTGEEYRWRNGPQLQRLADWALELGGLPQHEANRR